MKNAHLTLLSMAILLQGCQTLPVAPPLCEFSKAVSKVIRKPPPPPIPTPRANPKPNPSFPLNGPLESYRRFDYDACLLTLKKELETLPPTTPGYIDALLYAGASAYMLGEEDQAKDLFRRAHALDPRLKINSDEFPPEIVNCFQEANG